MPHSCPNPSLQLQSDPDTVVDRVIRFLDLDPNLRVKKVSRCGLLRFFTLNLLTHIFMPGFVRHDPLGASQRRTMAQTRPSPTPCAFSTASMPMPTASCAALRLTWTQSEEQHPDDDVAGE